MLKISSMERPALLEFAIYSVVVQKSKRLYARLFFFFFFFFVLQCLQNKWLAKHVTTLVEAAIDFFFFALI